MITLHETEKVLATYRKTWFVFLFTGITSVLMMLAPLLLYAFLSSVLESVFSVIPFELLLLITVLWWWAVWTSTFIAFANYYLDVFIVTDERILHINQHGPFSRTVAELRLERIQDVTIEQHGLIPTLIHFGTIRVQTAGETGSFSFVSVPYPAKVKETIMTAHGAALARHRNPDTPSEAL